MALKDGSHVINVRPGNVSTTDKAASYICAFFPNPKVLGEFSKRDVLFSGNDTFLKLSVCPGLGRRLGGLAGATGGHPAPVIGIELNIVDVFVFLCGGSGNKT